MNKIMVDINLPAKPPKKTGSGESNGRVKAKKDKRLEAFHKAFKDRVGGAIAFREKLIEERKK